MRDTLERAVAIAEEAAAVTLRYFRDSSLDVDRKGDGSVVTAADRATETLLRERIDAAWPADGVLGEEFGGKSSRNGRRWILDPIDGTVSFSRGSPQYGVLLGLEVDGEAVLGVGCLPALGETVFAARGEGAWWSRDNQASRVTTPARVSSIARLQDAMFLYTSARGFDRAGRLSVWETMRRETAYQRGWGDCLGHLLVATGRAELMIDPKLAIWDCAALLPILLEAGGGFFDFRGEITHEGSHGAISTNAALASEVRDLVL